MSRHYLGFLLADHDGRPQMNMNEHDQLMIARLEKEVLDVGEENVHPLLGAERRLIPETILVDLDLAGDALAFHRRAYVDIIQHRRSAVYERSASVYISG